MHYVHATKRNKQHTVTVDIVEWMNFGVKKLNCLTAIWLVCLQTIYRLLQMKLKVDKIARGVRHTSPLLNGFYRNMRLSCFLFFSLVVQSKWVMIIQSETGNFHKFNCSYLPSYSFYLTACLCQCVIMSEWGCARVSRLNKYL